MAIELPSRRGGGAPRRAVTTPAAENVPRARIARDPGVQASAGAFGADIGNAAQDAGAALRQAGQVAGEFHRAEQAQRLSAVTAQAAARLKEIEFQFEQDPDYATYERRYNEAADAILAEAEKELGSGTVFQAFQSEFATSRLNIGFNVRRLARKRQVDAGNAQLVRNLDRYADLYARSTNELEQQDIRNKALLDLADAAEVGLISQEERAKRELAWENGSEAVLVRRTIQEDPELAEAMLTDPESFRNLSEDTRVALSRQASARAETMRKERIRLLEKAERDADKARTDAQEREFGRLFGAVLEDAVTDRDLDQALAERRINGSQFARLRTTLESEAEPSDDPNVLLAMYEDLDDGLLTKERVLTAFSNGLITRERATELRNAIDRGVNEVQKNARRFVREHVGGVTGPMAVLDAQSSIRVANAEREFFERVAANEDPWEVADSVVSRYRRVEPNLTALPRPLFVSGDPDTLEGIEASMKRTVEAFENQQIDEETFRKEADILKQRENLIRERERLRLERSPGNSR